MIAEEDGPYYPKKAWISACEIAERLYLDMIESGVSPQIARSVLPNCLKTELVMTANLREFRHFITLRGSKAAHPQIHPIALAIWPILMDYAPSIFEDLTPIMEDIHDQTFLCD
jgi:thymidylate synthase (FAD)